MYVYKNLKKLSWYKEKEIYVKINLSYLTIKEYLLNIC